MDATIGDLCRNLEKNTAEVFVFGRYWWFQSSLDSESLEKLVNSLRANRSVKRLEIDVRLFSASTDISQICGHLESRPLDEVILHCPHAEAEELEPQARRIIDALSRNESLKALTLAGIASDVSESISQLKVPVMSFQWMYSEIGPQANRNIARAIASNPRMIELNVYDSLYTDILDALIEDALLGHLTLERLALSKYEGVRLGQLVESCPLLHHVTIFRALNYSKEQIESISQCSSLQSIRFEECTFSQDATDAFGSLVKTPRLHIGPRTRFTCSMGRAVSCAINQCIKELIVDVDLANFTATDLSFILRSKHFDTLRSFQYTVLDVQSTRYLCRLLPKLRNIQSIKFPNMEDVISESIQRQLVQAILKNGSLHELQLGDGLSGPEEQAARRHLIRNRQLPQLFKAPDLLPSLLPRMIANGLKTAKTVTHTVFVCLRGLDPSKKDF